MKLHQDRLNGLHAFTGYGPDHVIVGTRRLTTSTVVFADRVIEDWPIASVDMLTPTSLDFLAAEPIEIVLIGTGPKMALIHPRLYASVSAARIGVEVMDTFAACRTYNVLIAEGRKVVAAVMLPRPT